MLKKFIFLMVLLWAYPAWAQLTQTPNLGLYLIPFQYPNWNVPVNDNTTVIDTKLPTLNLSCGTNDVPVWSGGKFSICGNSRTVPTRSTIAGLPGAPVTNQLAVITDANSGSTCVTAGGSSNVICQWNGSAWIPVGSISGGGGTPGGANTQVQFNDGGVFGGDAGLTYNKTTDVLTVTGGVVASLTGNVLGNLTGNVTGNTTGAHTGAVTGNVTSSGQSTFTGSLLAPAKADPGSPITNEVWRSTSTRASLAWYDGAVQKAIKDSDFSANIGIMNKSATTPTYSILLPTDDTILIGSGTTWVSKLLQTCRPSIGRSISYDAATNNLDCEDIVTSGLASVTEDATFVNITKATKIGLTPFVDLTRGAGITANRVYTLARDVAGDVALTTGTLTQNQTSSYDSQGRLEASGTTKWFKAEWDGGGITPDGTQCADATKQTLDSTPQYAFSCAKNASSIFYTQIRLTRALTTFLATVSIFHAASEVITFAGDVSAKCRGDGEAMGGSWGTAVQADVVTQAVANQIQQTTTASITPNSSGGCTKGKILFIRWVIDEPNFSANAINSKVIGFSVEQDS